MSWYRDDNGKAGSISPIMGPRGGSHGCLVCFIAHVPVFISSWIEIKRQPYGIDMPGTITGEDNGAPHKVYGTKTIKQEGLAQVMSGDSIFVLTSTGKDDLWSNFPGRLVPHLKPLSVGVSKRCSDRYRAEGSIFLATPRLGCGFRFVYREG